MNKKIYDTLGSIRKTQEIANQILTDHNFS